MGAIRRRALGHVLDHAAACALLEAILIAWLQDARRDPQELRSLARFLETSPQHVRRLAENTVRRESTGTIRKLAPGRKNPRGRPTVL